MMLNVNLTIVACPTCGAAVAENCRPLGKRERTIVHVRRRRAARKATALSLEVGDVLDEPVYLKNHHHNPALDVFMARLPAEAEHFIYDRCAVSISTLRELAEMSKKDVLEMRGFGPQAYRELVKELRKAGVSNPFGETRNGVVGKIEQISKNRSKITLVMNAVDIRDWSVGDLISVDKFRATDTIQEV